jgi:RIO kinase 1
MVDPLEPLLADGVVDEVLSRLKSGKEADVWLVRHAGEIVTAKVYRARDTRSFKNNAAYTEGRRVRNTRTQRAMDRGSRFGQAAAEDAWKSKEADALYRLHAAGLRVPRPVMFYEGVLLMEVVVDAHGHPAPRLIDAPVAAEEVAGLYAVLRKQVVGMLCCDLVHGDLSPFNVLVASDGPVVIDFPQVVDAAHNQQAERFFLRDLGNIQKFCAGVDPALQAAAGDGAEIWRAYVRRELSPDFVPSGRPVSRPARGGRPDGSRDPGRDSARDAQPRGGAAQRPRPGGPPGPDAHPRPVASDGPQRHRHEGGDASRPRAPRREAEGAPEPGRRPRQGGPGGSDGQGAVDRRGPSFGHGHPQGGGHPQAGGHGRAQRTASAQGGAPRGAPGTGGQRPQRGQGRPMPEVVRVERPLHGTLPGGTPRPGAPRSPGLGPRPPRPAQPGGGHGGGQPSGGGSPGGGHRRRRGGR